LGTERRSLGFEPRVGDAGTGKEQKKGKIDGADENPEDEAKKPKEKSDRGQTYGTNKRGSHSISPNCAVRAVNSLRERGVGKIKKQEDRKR